MLHGIVAAGLQDVIETDDVGFDIDIWMINGIADPCLDSEVYYYIKVVVREQLVNQNLCHARR